MNAGQQQQPPLPPHATQQQPAPRSDPPTAPPGSLPVVAPTDGARMSDAAAWQREQQQNQAQRAAVARHGYHYLGQDAAVAAAAGATRSQQLLVGAPGGMPPAPGGPTQPHNPPETGHGQSGGWRVRRHRAISRLCIGDHHAPDDALDQIQLAGSSFGFQLGRNQAGFPVTMNLFRPRPMSLFLVGGLWMARLLALRALRFGVRVVVSTTQPDGWAALGRSVTGRSDRVIVLDSDTSSDVVASADAHVLRLHDAPHPPPAERAAPWRTQLIVLRRLPPDGMAYLPHADAVLAQRLMPNEAVAVASALRQPPNTAHQLQTLRDDMMATLGRTGRSVYWVSLSRFEHERLGPASRN